MVNMQLYTFVFYNKGGLHITCNKYEGMFRHLNVFMYAIMNYR